MFTSPHGELLIMLPYMWSDLTNYVCDIPPCLFMYFIASATWQQEHHQWFYFLSMDYGVYVTPSLFVY